MIPKKTDCDKCFHKHTPRENHWCAMFKNKPERFDCPVFEEKENENKNK